MSTKLTPIPIAGIFLNKLIAAYNWSDATSLLQEGKTVADSLISLSNQINDGSIQFAKNGDTLSEIAQANGMQAYYQQH
jgi:hypothetical protein